MDIIKLAQLVMVIGTNKKLKDLDFVKFDETEVKVLNKKGNLIYTFIAISEQGYDSCHLRKGKVDGNELLTFKYSDILSINL